MASCEDRLREANQARHNGNHSRSRALLLQAWALAQDDVARRRVLRAWFRVAEGAPADLRFVFEAEWLRLCIADTTWHPSTLTHSHELVRLAQVSQQEPTAICWLESVLHAAYTTGASVAEVVKLCEWLARLNKRAGELPEAARWLEVALLVQHQATGLPDPNLKRLLAYLLGKEAPDLAEQHLREAILLASAQEGETSAFALRFWEALARFFRGLDQPAQAQLVYAEARALFQSAELPSAEALRWVSLRQASQGSPQPPGTHELLVTVPV